MTNLTTRIEEVLALQAKATKGEWIAVNCQSWKHNSSVAWRNQPGCEFVMVYSGDESDEGAEQRDNDATFIASAHTMADLLREVLPMVRERDAIVTALRDWLDDESAHHYIVMTTTLAKIESAMSANKEK